MQNCYSNRAYMHDYCNFLYDFFFSFLSLAFSNYLSPSLQYQEQEEEEEDSHNQPKIKPRDSNNTTTANPLQHQFNPNTINPKSMKNHHKPNLKSTQNKTLENLFGKIQST